MLADSRTARVPGRIVFLIVSITTIKDMRAEGVPWGTRCANIELVKLTHPIKIKANHKGRDKEKLVIIWLVPVKTNGNKPKKLLNTKNKNNPKKNIVLPFKGPVPNRILISL